MSVAISTAVALAGVAVSAGSAIAGASRARKNSKNAAVASAKASAAVDAAGKPVRDFQFENVYEGIGDGATYDPTTIEGASFEAGSYQSQGAEAGNLGASREAQAAQLGPAGQVSLRNLAGGADFLSNSFSNLQVGTAAADLQGSQTDQALASQQASGQVTGGGGATALAQAAAASKQGISANIQQQELGNQKLQAQGQQTLEQGLLAQSNAGQQFGSQQDQFNVGQRNDFAKTQAGLTQQANLQNASSANQFAQSQFSADNNFSQFNAQNANQASQFNTAQGNNAAQYGASSANAANTFNAQQYTGADQFAANQANSRELLELQGRDQQQERSYNQNVDLLNAASGNAAQQSQNQIAATNAQASVIGAGIGAVGSSIGALAGSDFSGKRFGDS